MENTGSEARRELAALRQVYYGLFVRLLWKEPDEEFVASLAEGLEERAESAGQLEPLMGEGWRTIGDYLRDHDPGEVVDEFTQLFLGPQQPDLSPYESRYLSGMLYKEPLIHVREFMASVGLEKSGEDFPEPEDVLAFELEIMNWLLSKEIASGDGPESHHWFEKQAEFLKRHLLVWAPACAQDMQNAEHGVFYRGVGQLLEGFLKTEALGVHGVGPEKVETLQEARARYRRRPSWKGETYDPDPVGQPETDTEN